MIKYNNYVWLIDGQNGFIYNSTSPEVNLLLAPYLKSALVLWTKM